MLDEMTRDKELQRVVAKLATQLSNGYDVAVFTSRELVQQDLGNPGHGDEVLLDGLELLERFRDRRQDR